MKTFSLILTICLLFLCSSSYSQVRADTKTVRHNPIPAVVTKGYYAIPDNAGKNTSSGVEIQAATNDSLPATQKGYYSIDKKKKPAKKIVVKVGKKTKPVASKGYYAIDRNKED